MPAVTGPVNIQQGNLANFVVEYFDAAGVYTNPTSASILVSYVNTGNVQTTDTVTLDADNRFWTGVWDTINAALGLATWTAYANGTATNTTGQLRIIDRVT